MRMKVGIVAVVLLLGIWWSVDVAQRTVRAGVAGRTSDIKLQWIVARYALRGSNPYDASLKAAAATRRSQRRPVTSPHQVIDPNLTDRTSSVIPDYRAPVAAYPPFTVAILALTLGWVPFWLVDPLWMAINVLVILLFPRVLQQFVPASLGPSSRILGYLAALALIMIWPATSAMLKWGQLSLLSLGAALLGVAELGRRPLTSGAWFALSLIKPSIAVPFLVLPLVRGNWIALAVAAGVHAVATILLALWVGEWPWVMLGQWAEVGRLFQQFGMYSLKEVMVALGLLNSLWDDILTGAFLAAVAMWTWLYRDADELAVLSFLSCVSLLWAYHSRHDFVVFLIPIFYALRVQLTSDIGQGSRRPLLVPIVCGFFLGLALLETIYDGEAMWAQALRWAGRVSLAAAFAWTAAEMRRSPLVGQVAISSGALMTDRGPYAPAES